MRPLTQHEKLFPEHTEKQDSDAVVQLKLIMLTCVQDIPIPRLSSVADTERLQEHAK